MTTIRMSQVVVGTGFKGNLLRSSSLPTPVATTTGRQVKGHGRRACLNVNRHTSTAQHSGVKGHIGRMPICSLCSRLDFFPTTCFFLQNNRCPLFRGSSIWRFYCMCCMCTYFGSFPGRDRFRETSANLHFSSSSFSFLHLLR